MKFSELVESIKFWYYWRKYMGSILSSFIPTEINKYFKNNSPLKSLSKEQKNQLTSYIYQDSIRIMTSQNPVLENRFYLTNWICEMSRYLVLITPTQPKMDQTFSFLTGRTDVSGVLNNYIIELAEKYEELQPFFKDCQNILLKEDVSASHDVISRIFLIQEQACSVRVTVANLIRVYLKDVNEQHDWFNEYIACMCAYNEYKYRKFLNLPNILDDMIPNAAKYPDLIYPHFTNLIITGNTDPYNTWVSDAKNFKLP